MKTIEDKAIEYANNELPLGHRHFGCKAYIAGAKEALAGQWRSVEDELPDGTSFCITMADEESRLCLCHFDGDVFIEDYSGLVCAVKYWMPIPFLPPKD